MKNRERFFSTNSVRKNEEAFDFREIRISFGYKRRFIDFYKTKKKIWFLRIEVASDSIPSVASKRKKSKGFLLTQ